MARYLYIGSDPARAVTLGCGYFATPPPGLPAVTPPAVVIVGAGQVVTLSDNPPTTPAAVATAAAPIVSAEAAQQAAQAQLQANQATITTNVQTAQAQIAAFIAANPGGATLNGAQTIILARMLNGLCKILLADFASTTGT